MYIEQRSHCVDTTSSSTAMALHLLSSAQANHVYELQWKSRSAFTKNSVKNTPIPGSTWNKTTWNNALTTSHQICAVQKPYMSPLQVSHHEQGLQSGHISSFVSLHLLMLAEGCSLSAPDSWQESSLFSKYIRHWSLILQPQLQKWTVIN